MNIKFRRTSWENWVNFIQLYDALCIDIRIEVHIYARTRLHYENLRFLLPFGRQRLFLHILSLSQTNHSSNKMKHRKCYLFGVFLELYPTPILLKRLTMYLKRTSSWTKNRLYQKEKLSCCSLSATKVAKHATMYESNIPSTHF